SDGTEAVLRRHEHVRADLAGVPDQVGNETIDGAEGGAAARIVGSVALVVVVEVRQVHERQRRAVPAEDEPRGVGDPARRGEAGAGTPEVEEREWTQRTLELVLQVVGLRVDAGNLAAVGGIRGARSDGPVRARVHVVPPEQLGAGEAGETAARRLPHFLAGDETVGLSPEPDLREIPEVPAVA